MNNDFRDFIKNNNNLFNELADAYAKEHPDNYNGAQMARKFIMNHYKGDNAELQKLIFKKISRLKNNNLSKTLDHLGEMSMYEFRQAIEKLTDWKVCVNGGKAYLHVYNWLFKNGNKTRYRTRNYYLTIGNSCERTMEQAQVIAAKCLEFAKIENYGQNEKVPVEKF